ncbi:hypothetical protein [Neptuniibacter sp. QD37_11]|uniref:hypothetical protein n=1 Tax=Neptuniibacter sp. QD37_11 TaxID=3398209 RepID=UPI0039F549FD
MYKPTTFLKLAKEAQNEEVSKESLEEVREVSRPSVIHNKSYESWDEFSDDLIEAEHSGEHGTYLDNLKSKIEEETLKLESINREYAYISNSIADLSNLKTDMVSRGESDGIHVDGLSSNINALRLKLAQIKKMMYICEASIELKNKELASFQNRL